MARQERLADSIRAQQVRDRLNVEVVVVNDRVRRRLRSKRLPFERGELAQWGAAMGELLHWMILEDAGEVILAHALPWLKRREQAASTIAKRALRWLYQPNGPMVRRGARDLGSLIEA